MTVADPGPETRGSATVQLRGYSRSGSALQGKPLPVCHLVIVRRPNIHAHTRARAHAHTRARAHTLDDFSCRLIASPSLELTIERGRLA